MAVAQPVADEADRSDAVGVSGDSRITVNGRTPQLRPQMNAAPGDGLPYES